MLAYVPQGSPGHNFKAPTPHPHLQLQGWGIISTDFLPLAPHPRLASGHSPTLIGTIAEKSKFAVTDSWSPTGDQSPHIPPSFRQQLPEDPGGREEKRLEA